MRGRWHFKSIALIVLPRYEFVGFPVVILGFVSVDLGLLARQVYRLASGAKWDAVTPKVRGMNQWRGNDGFPIATKAPPWLRWFVGVCAYRL